MAGFFSRLRGKEGQKVKPKKGRDLDGLSNQLPQKPRWEDAWTRQTVEPEEIQELIGRCTEELKARALDLPFLLLPFRPTSDPSAVRTFVRHFFDSGHGLRGQVLGQELRMIEPMVISGVIKWCWSRLAGGVVGWDSYELFKVGEHDSNMARDSFKTFIPLSVESDAKSAIIFDFFDLMSAIAAHGKSNGFGGRKLSRMAAWWAFEHKDTGSGFEGGYKTWLSAADATSHLFFAYLRSLAPEQNVSGISMLPMSLEKLLQETEYPPQKPSLMQSTTNRVVMIVDTVSPTPFALLRRANHFQYRDDDRALREWSEYEDPVQALTEECRRVLKAISAANQSQAVSSSKHSTGLRDASWSRFEDIGFGSALEEEEDEEEKANNAAQRKQGLRTTAASGNGLARPTTPSWADFLSSGFVEERATGMLLPPDKVLPPIDTNVRQRSSQSHRPRLETTQHLEPGELASITRFDLDDSFWWVWMSSLAPEETPERKSAFGRCAVIETVIRTGRWLVMEEMVKGAAPEPEAGAYIAEKKGLFSWTRRSKGVSRSKSTGKHALDKGNGHLKPSAAIGASKTSIGPDQQARIQAAAQQLQLRQLQESRTELRQPMGRRGRSDQDVMAEKTSSILTLQPVIMSEASPAMKWANKYDKDAIREAYLANSNAGRGLATSTMQTNGHSSPATNGYDRPPEVPSKEPSLLVSPSASAIPRSPSFRRDDEEPEPVTLTQALTEKSVNKPADLHPAERSEPAPLTPAVTPPPHMDPQVTEPPQQSLESARDNVISPEPQEPPSPQTRKQLNKLHKEKEKEKDKEKSGGFRKLFGRKNRQSKLPANAGESLKAMGIDKPNMVVEPSAVPEQPSAPERAPEQHEETHDEILAEEPSHPAPIEEPVAEPAYEPAPEEEETAPESRINTADALEARTEFSRFDQGPLIDQPAFVPDGAAESDDDAVPPPIQRHPSRSPISSPKEEDQPAGLPAQDRWAQIRKNAAERAAQRMNDEPSRGGYSKTDDGDDTSGEETIESRVARIKARVAELTGNIETQGGPGTRTPPTIRR